MRVCVAVGTAVSAVVVVMEVLVVIVRVLAVSVVVTDVIDVVVVVVSDELTSVMVLRLVLKAGEAVAVDVIVEMGPPKHEHALETRLEGYWDT